MCRVQCASGADHVIKPLHARLFCMFFSSFVVVSVTPKYYLHLITQPCWDICLFGGGVRSHWISRNKHPIWSFCCRTVVTVSLFHCVKPSFFFFPFFSCKRWNMARARWPVARPCGSIQCPVLLMASPSFHSSSSSSYSSYSSFLSSSSSASSSLFFRNCSKRWMCPWDTRTNPGKASQFISVVNGGG